ncbi:DNA replication terminus site-binding protein [Marinospirillum sp. MEB164]|uniref:DNA replication terminus site-binding protein n=1 Tax=Marinospirillum alkalitolerans TaxID=3123374 RepID=A0ABW8PUI4_9GAMM
MTTHYRLLQQLDARFDALLAALHQLQQSLLEEQPRCWMHGVSDHQALEQVHFCLTDLWYLDGQDGRATRSYPGLVACSPRLWEEVGQVNQAKLAFSWMIEQLRKEAPQELSEARQQLAQRHASLHQHLSQDGLARLHLKQAWRQLPGCERPLQQVRFSWYSSGRSIRKITLKEAEYRLQEMNTDAAHIQIQLKKLAHLPPDEPLAQVQKQAPLMRANLFFRTEAGAAAERQAMNVALPLFLLSEDGRLPAFNQPPIEPPAQRTRARRSDNRLEDEPFLPSLRVYRYSRPK